jgi:hypothetical protein
MLFLKNISDLEAISNLKLQKFANFRYAYYIAEYLAYIIMLYTKKALNWPGKRNLYLKILFYNFLLIDFYN